MREENDTRFFVFFLRRYYFDEKEGKFVPGSLSIGQSLGDVLDQSDGLSAELVSRNRAIVGYNTIEMKTPNIFRTIFNEFAKPFYTYQLFMVWTWFPLW